MRKLVAGNRGGPSDIWTAFSCLKHQRLTGAKPNAVCEIRMKYPGFDFRGSRTRNLESMTLHDLAEMTAVSNDTPSGEVFHYTSADTAIFNILTTGKLRLSPMHSTNDPWESEPLNPGFSIVDDETFDGAKAYAAWSEIDSHIRLHSKVLCLTQDWGNNLPRFEGQRRGWRHLSSWAHYGGRHSGICLGFDLNALSASFQSIGGKDALRVAGPITYWTEKHAPFLDQIDTRHLYKYGTDAVARHYAEVFKNEIFLTKHADWQAEFEFRFALMNESKLPEYIDMRKALTSVFVGHSFPDRQLPALYEVLAQYEGVDVRRMRYHSRTTQALPPGDTDIGKETQFPPTQSGSLLDRVAELDREASYYVPRSPSTPRSAENAL